MNAFEESRFHTLFLTVYLKQIILSYLCEAGNFELRSIYLSKPCLSHGNYAVM